jgi:hypothetical protein
MSAILTYDDCIAKAVALEQISLKLPSMRADCLQIATAWRHLAEQTKYQNGLEPNG